MKKTLFLFLMAIALAGNAQITLQLGFTRSFFYANEFKNFKLNSILSPMGGIYFNSKISNLFSIESGFQYQSLSESSYFNKDYKFKNHYLTAPIALNYKHDALISPGIGIQAAYKIHSKENLVAVQEHNFDLSMFGKLNLNLTKSFGVEIGYNIGFLPFYDKKIIDHWKGIIGEVAMKNQSTYMSLNFRL
jgi:hypothetical protein